MPPHENPLTAAYLSFAKGPTQATEDEILTAATEMSQISTHDPSSIMDEGQKAPKGTDKMPDSLGHENLHGCSGDVQNQHFQDSDPHDQNSALDSSGHSALKMAQNGGKSNFSKIADEKAVAMPAIKALSEPSAAQFDLNSQGFNGSNGNQSGFLNLPMPNLHNPLDGADQLHGA